VRIEFRFNGNAQAILVPENARDKSLVQLFMTGGPDIRLVSAPAAMPEALIFESYEEKETNAVDNLPGS
jgi:hypothetical protein